LDSGWGRRKGHPIPGPGFKYFVRGAGGGLGVSEEDPEEEEEEEVVVVVEETCRCYRQ
jgi:hypothetical protein